MTTYHLSCAGWSYPDWRGTFYPQGAAEGDFLAAYARTFRFAEVSSAYYGTPRRDIVQRWASHTPDDFLFSVKFPEDITRHATQPSTTARRCPFPHACGAVATPRSCHARIETPVGQGAGFTLATAAISRAYPARGSARSADRGRPARAAAGPAWVAASSGGRAGPGRAVRVPRRVNVLREENP